MKSSYNFYSNICVCRAEKTSKLQTIPGTLDIAVDYIPMEHPSTCTLLPPFCVSIYVHVPLHICLLLPFRSSTASCVWNSFFSFSFRLCDILLCASKALWGTEQTPAHGGGGGVCPGHHQVHTAAPCLQKPHLCLPETPQIRQSEELCQGILQYHSLRGAWVKIITVLYFYCSLCFLFLCVCVRAVINVTVVLLFTGS